MFLNWIILLVIYILYAQGVDLLLTYISTLSLTWSKHHRPVAQHACLHHWVNENGHICFVDMESTPNKTQTTPIQIHETRFHI
jgi:hypothetical protein